MTMNGKKRWEVGSLSLSDLVYVLHGIDDNRITRGDAPSPGAWAMLLLARNRKGFDVDFVKTFVKPVYERMAKEEERKKQRFDDGRDLSTFIMKVRAARVKAIREGDEDATRALGIQVVKKGAEYVPFEKADKEDIRVKSHEAWAEEKREIEAASAARAAAEKNAAVSAHT